MRRGPLGLTIASATEAAARKPEIWGTRILEDTAGDQMFRGSEGVGRSGKAQAALYDYDEALKV